MKSPLNYWVGSYQVRLHVLHLTTGSNFRLHRILAAPAVVPSPQ